MLSGPELFGAPSAVNIGFAVGGGHADGQLLQGSAVAAHGVALEVGENQHGIIIGQVLAHVILVNHLAVWNVQLQVGPLGVQQVDGEFLAPAVISKQLAVPFSGVSGAVISCVAFNHGAAHVIDDGLPEAGAQEILISLFAGVNLDRHPAGKLLSHQLEKLQNLFRSDFVGEIDS